MDREFVASRVEMEEILNTETVGYLGLIEDGVPYVLPLNYGYLEGRIIFHCAFTGKKLDCIRSHPLVCFTVARQEGAVKRHSGENPCHADNDSVICYGKARVIDELSSRHTLLNDFNVCYNPDADPISPEDAEKCCGVEISVLEMTGRRERKEGTTFWRWRF